MKTLQESLTLVPEYFPLVPGVDKWEDGDEYCLTEAVKLAKAGWQKIGDGAVGLELPTKDCETRGGWFIVETVIGIGVRIASDYIARRPIPQNVREAEAFWILHGKPFNPPSGSKIDALGGMDNIQEHYDEGPGALWRWVEENRK